MAQLQGVPGSSRADETRWLALGAIAVLMGLAARQAWVTEDAYITLRTADNWLSGFGLTWNTDERVQGYTHPLWMLLLTGVYALVRNAFASAILLGLGATLAALVVLTRHARSVGHAVIAILLLALSRAFIEFSTSGLENALTHLLCGVFVVLYVRREASLMALCLSAALLALNRADALIITLPALLEQGLSSLRVRGLKATAKALGLGFAPLALWELFSLFYYGFLVPNTAYAKLNTGLERVELARQGVTYLFNALAWDPPLLFGLLLGLGLAFWERRARPLLVAVGALLYLVYVVQIGGDFMVGRFLTLPLFAAAMLVSLSSAPLEQPRTWAALALPLLSHYFIGAGHERFPVGDYRHSGVADERGYFREQATLMMFARTRELPEHEWTHTGREARALGRKVIAHTNIGYLGFAAGPHVHIIDVMALTDPLLARLPARYEYNWRVGHYAREIPKGYAETLESGVCRLEDRALCTYYEKLRLIISGDLWSWQRIQAIALMNIGRYDPLIDKERYRYPALARGRRTELAREIPEGAAWNDARARVFTADGLEVELGRVEHGKSLRMMLDSNESYRIELRRGNELVERLTAPTSSLPGLRTRKLRPKPESVQRGYDRLIVRPVGGDGYYSIGHLRLSP